MATDAGADSLPTLKRNFSDIVALWHLDGCRGKRLCTRVNECTAKEAAEELKDVRSTLEALEMKRNELGRRTDIVEVRKAFADAWEKLQQDSLGIFKEIFVPARDKDGECADLIEAAFLKRVEDADPLLRPARFPGVVKGLRQIMKEINEAAREKYELAMEKNTHAKSAEEWAWFMTHSILPGLNFNDKCNQLAKRLDEDEETVKRRNELESEIAKGRKVVKLLAELADRRGCDKTTGAGNVDEAEAEAEAEAKEDEGEDDDEDDEDDDDDDEEEKESSDLEAEAARKRPAARQQGRAAAKRRASSSDPPSRSLEPPSPALTEAQTPSPGPGSPGNGRRPNAAPSDGEPGSKPGKGANGQLPLCGTQQAELNAQLLDACKAGYLEKVTGLLKKGADVHAKTSKGSRPLHLACLYGHEGVAKLLLDNGADVHAKKDDSWLALHIACYNGHEGVAKLLLKNGADVHAKKDDSWRPLHLACRYGHEGVAKLLLDNGADVHAETNKGWRPLHLACWGGHEGIAKLLLDNGADVHAKDTYGHTPLHDACANGHEGVAKLLIEKGAKKDVKNEEGQTPLSLAASKGHTEIVDFLEVVKFSKENDIRRQSLAHPLHPATAFSDL